MSSGITFANNKIIVTLDRNHHTHRRNLKISTFTKSTKTLASERNMQKHPPIDRFKKHTNLVEANKLNLQRTPFSASHPDCRTPLAPPRKEKKQLSFLPRTQEDFLGEQEKGLAANPMGRFSTPDVNLLSSSSLQSILVKQDMKKPRNLLSYNILSLEKKYDFSRFQLHTLYSLFHTLLSDAKWSLSRFKRGFEVMFNMHKVALRPQTLDNIFREQEQIDFESFIHMYRKIDQTIYKQSIVDYVEILFEGVYHKDKITFDDIVRIMKNRITEKESIDIARIVFEGIDRNEDQIVKLSEIFSLCHHCDSFAKKMYLLYTRECKTQ